MQNVIPWRLRIFEKIKWVVRCGGVPVGGRKEIPVGGYGGCKKGGKVAQESVAKAKRKQK